MARQREYEEAGVAAPSEVMVEVAEDLDGELVATISWGDWVSDGLTRHGDTIGPMAVGKALAKADEVAELYGFERVVVSLSGAHVWNPNWGTLRRQPFDNDALTHDDLREADDGDEGRTPLTDPDDEDGSSPNP